MKHSKRYRKAAEGLDKRTLQPLDEAIETVLKSATTKFDESIEVAVRLGVDPRKADQMVRGTVILPHGTGKPIRVCVLAKEDKEKEALDAGADFFGSDDLIKKISDGWFEFDVVIATPDIMSQVGKLGRVLGPRGLMPNPKTGTVTVDVGQAVQDAKSGKIDFRVDRYGIIHVAIGKKSFEAQKIKENLQVFMDTVQRLRPSTSKGVYIKSLTLCSTMGPGVRIDKSTVSEAA